MNYILSNAFRHNFVAFRVGLGFRFILVSGLLGLEDEGECEDEGSGSASIC